MSKPEQLSRGRVIKETPSVERLSTFLNDAVCSPQSVSEAAIANTVRVGSVVVIGAKFPPARSNSLFGSFDLLPLLLAGDHSDPQSAGPLERRGVSVSLAPLGFCANGRARAQDSESLRGGRAEGSTAPGVWAARRAVDVCCFDDFGCRAREMTPTITAKITTAAMATSGHGLKDFRTTASRSFGAGDVTGSGGGGGITGATADGGGAIGAGATTGGVTTGTSSVATFLPLTSTD